MKKAPVNRASKDGTPERIRTSDLVFRKHPLYPTELREQINISCLLCGVYDFCLEALKKWL